VDYLALLIVTLLALYFYKKSKKSEFVSSEIIDKDQTMVTSDIPNEFKQMFSDEDYDAARAYLQQIAYGMLDKNIPKSEKILFKAMITYFADHDPLYKTIIQKLYKIIQNKEGYIQSEIYKELPEYDTETIRYVLYFGHELEDIFRVKRGRSYHLYTKRSKRFINNTDNYEEGVTYITREGKSVKADEAFFASSSNDLKRMIKATKIKTNPTDRHYLLQAIVQKTYSNRKLSNKDKDLCLKFAQIHLDEMETILPSLKKEFDELPRIVTFQHYATALTEDQRYQEAVDVCKKAIEYKLHDGTQSGFEGRIKRIMKKAGI